MAAVDSFLALMTVKYMNVRKQQRMQTEIEQERAKLADQWNKNNNAVSLEEAEKIYSYCCNNKNEVYDFLVDRTDRDSEEYQKQVQKYRGLNLEKLSEAYCQKKYGKNCYPMCSKMRHDFYWKYVKIADMTVANKYKRKWW